MYSRKAVLVGLLFLLLGVCYADTQSTADEKAKAESYRKAAEQGDAKAQYELGWCYEKGQGVAQNNAEAVRWYRLAAEQGYTWAQYSLGVCYANGQGVAKDLTEAANWYRKAADQGFAAAKEALEELTAQ